MYLTVWQLTTLGGILAVLVWSNWIRGRALACLKGCYIDLSGKVEEANTAALLDMVDGKPPGDIHRDLEHALISTCRAHHAVLAKILDASPRDGDSYSLELEAARSGRPSWL